MELKAQKEKNREQLEDNYKWDLSDLYSSDEEWKKYKKRIYPL